MELAAAGVSQPRGRCEDAAEVVVGAFMHHLMMMEQLAAHRAVVLNVVPGVGNNFVTIAWRAVCLLCWFEPKLGMCGLNKNEPSHFLLGVRSKNSIT